MKRQIGLKLFDVDATMKQYFKRLYPDHADVSLQKFLQWKTKMYQMISERENTNPINHPALEGINVLDLSVIII